MATFVVLRHPENSGPKILSNFNYFLTIAINVTGFSSIPKKQKKTVVTVKIGLKTRLE